MIEVADCIITNSEEGRGAYGLRIDNEQSVYFPVNMTDTLQLVEFDQVKAVLRTNDRPVPIWKAAHVDRLKNLAGE